MAKIKSGYTETIINKYYYHLEDVTEIIIVIDGLLKYIAGINNEHYCCR